MRTWHQTFATSWVYLYKPHIKYIYAIEISLKNYQCVSYGLVRVYLGPWDEGHPKIYFHDQFISIMYCLKKVLVPRWGI